MRERLGETFAQYDVMLTPSAAALPWPAQEVYPSTIAGKEAGPRGHAVYTAFVNAAGCAAVSLPCEPSASGLPIGFQLVAPAGNDERLCVLASEYEAAAPWADRWPAAMSTAVELLLASRRSGRRLSGAARRRAPANDRATRTRSRMPSLQRLAPIGGWKVGAKSASAEPTCAPLPATLILRSPQRFAAGRFAVNGIEAELAFTLSRDCLRGRNCIA